MSKSKKKPGKKRPKAVTVLGVRPLKWKPVDGFPNETQATPTNPFAQPDDEGLCVGTSKHTCGECGRVDWSWGFGGDVTDRGFASERDAQIAAEAWWHERVLTLLSRTPVGAHR